MKPVYVTGNEHKAKLFNEMLGLNLEHIAVDVDEIQSLDLHTVIAHKARQAYSQLNRPVVVEDTSLSFTELNRLPGTLVKWFIEDLGLEKICRLLDGLESRQAIASAALAYYDGETLEVFESQQLGRIAKSPKGNTGFGWNAIFIPEGTKNTMGEMDHETFIYYYKQIKPFDELKTFLIKLDKK